MPTLAVRSSAAGTRAETAIECRIDCRNEQDYLASGFRDVDAADGRKMINCLRLLDSLPSFRHYKNEILARLKLQPGQISADLGCGLGFDVERMSHLVLPGGLVLGVDASSTLLNNAGSLQPCGLRFVRADIASLPFRNSSLDSCKVDRTLQHVERPAAVLTEMFRVLRAGGTVVCAEPDWSTFTIRDDDRAVVRRIAEFWTGSFRHPRIGGELSGVLRHAGFIDVETQSSLLLARSFSESDQVFDVVQTATALAQSDANDEPLEWISEARRHDRLSPLQSSVMLFIATGHKP